jgi:hypothetical protein
VRLIGVRLVRVQDRCNLPFPQLLAFFVSAAQRRFVLPLAALLAGSLAGAGLRAQDLVGCQLVEGSLQCVPGVTADPQLQIRILRKEIANDQQIEGAVEQRVAGLDRLLLQGEARQGQLLTVTAAGSGLATLPPSAFHWYRLAPGRRQWQLIKGAGGPTYALTAADVAYQVMVVIAVPTSSGSQRSVSQVLGPIMANPIP